MAEALARVKYDLPGVGRPVISNPSALDTGTQHGPPFAPFTSSQATTPAPAAAAAPPSQSQGAVGFRPRPVQVGTAGGGITVNLSPQDIAIKQSMQAIDDAMAGGITPTAAQAERIAGLRQQAGFLRGGTDHYVSGPDGRPLMQGIRQPMPDVATQQGGGLTQGQVASMNADRILRGSASGGEGPPAQYASGAPSRTWQQAAANDIGAIQNAAERRDYYRGIRNAQIESQLATGAAQAANDAERNRITYGLGMAQVGNAADKNAIDAAEAKSAAGLRQAQGAYYTAQAESGKYTPTYYEVLQGPKGMETAVKMPLLVDAKTGQTIDPMKGFRQARQAPQQALNALLQNKDDKNLRDAFMQKYGYLPEGM